MKQEHIGIKFHSIYYRYPLFIFAAAVMVLFAIGGADAYIGWGEMCQITTVGQVCFILNVIFGAVFVGCSFTGWKISVCRDGIYIKKIDLFVPFDEIVGISHVWINHAQHISGNLYLYNRKMIVIYGKDAKPICVYNISLIALWIVKMYAPSIKVNLISATLATACNVILNSAIFYFGYALNFNVELFGVYCIWSVLYIIKCVVIPLIMLKTQNKIWGYYLHHATAHQQNSADVINC